MQKRWTSIISALLGNTIEWYEYTLYAYFATILSQIFFPAGDHLIALSLTFATFAIGLAARPLGGIIFGYLADRYSRRQTMTFTMLMMSIPTLCIGMLPTYEQIGICAPIILIGLRILQGLALGGEFGSSCVYLYESVPIRERGFYGTLPLTGVGMGLVLSSCTIFIIESLFTHEEVVAYAWRYPFFIGVLGSVIALYMRSNLLETQDFIQMQEKNDYDPMPILTLFKKHKLTLLKLFAIFLTTQVSFFVVFIYGKTMMIDTLGYDNSTAGKYSLYTVLSYTITTLVVGYTTAKMNKRYVILFGALGLLLSALPFIRALQGGDPQAILFVCLLMGMFIGITEGSLNPIVAASFPVNIRTTSVAFCWNFTAIAFGGAAPIISMWLVEKTGSIEFIAYTLIGMCLITILSILLTISFSKHVATQQETLA